MCFTDYLVLFSSPFPGVNISYSLELERDHPSDILKRMYFVDGNSTRVFRLKGTLELEEENKIFHQYVHRAFLIVSVIETHMDIPLCFGAL